MAEAALARNILANFERYDMYRLRVDDKTERLALHKQLKRSDELYTRVPVGTSEAEILTTAAHPAAELIADDERIRVVTDIVTEHFKPFSEGSSSEALRRRISSSRNWGGIGKWHEEKSWSLEGTSQLPQDDRVAIYKDEGCDPTEAFDADRHLGQTYDIALAPRGSEEMEHLGERLRLRKAGSNDQPPERTGEGVRGFAAYASDEDVQRSAIVRRMRKDQTTRGPAACLGGDMSACPNCS